MSDARAGLLAALDHNRQVAVSSGSPFYATLLDHMREDIVAGGPTWRLLEPYADEPPTEYYVYRALAGVHHEVLAGERPALAAHYPSAGGDGDAEAVWPDVREAFAARDPEVLADLRHPLQTNETSRCGALVGGFCEVARRTGMPLRILELGSSAGLNLHLDRYRYEAGGMALGPADSPVCFVDYWEGGVPPLDAPLEIVERRGCDLDPIDATGDHGRLALQSYVWPDELARLAMLRGALEVAQTLPVTVDTASAETWVADQLAAPAAAGVATVVFHSIFWPYPPESVCSAITESLQAAGTLATADTPLAWLRYEPGEAATVVELRLTVWPDGPTDALLATGGFHFHPVRWLATSD